MARTLGTCGICKEREAIYKCPKCSIVYCSIPCYKNEALHQHLGPKFINTIEKSDPSSARNNDDGETHSNTNKRKADDPLPLSKQRHAGDQVDKTLSRDTIFDYISRDADIVSMLRYDSLHFHCLVLSKLLTDPDFSKEANSEGRLDVANLKLCDLRKGGSEENILVEDFAQRILELYTQYENDGRA